MLKGWVFFFLFQNSRKNTRGLLNIQLIEGAVPSENLKGNFLGNTLFFLFVLHFFIGISSSVKELTVEGNFCYQMFLTTQTKEGMDDIKWHICIHLAFSNQ